VRGSVSARAAGKPVCDIEDAADPAYLEAVFLIESLTNDRLRDEVGEITLVPPADRVSGPGSSFVMGAFTHLPPGGSRFSDGSFGVFYAARERETSIAETVRHRERFLRETAAPADAGGHARAALRRARGDARRAGDAGGVAGDLPRR
jgi:hypothetical protein